MSLVRRSVLSLSGLAAVAAGLLGPTASADAPPGCTAADMANTVTGVTASTSGYLYAHPDVNAFYTELRDRPDDEVPEAIRSFFADHPQAHADLLGLRQPLTDFRARCGLPQAEPPLLDQ
ncbi:heme-binding protein [Mycobacterium sp. UM_Kg1]|uniref:heme-binding protein n=1 Tax=Mycobacterium sp. UM_Kg1 TaxID=1545691 RepID=UPI00061B37A6|nr:heme-binding protein [Mycobacterium sp. UM_Kg1]